MSGQVAKTGVINLSQIDFDASGDANLSTVVNFNCANPVRDQLNHHLESRSRPEQLSSILNLLRTANDASEYVAEIAAEAWDFLQTRRLWEIKYPSLEALQKDIEFEDEVSHMLQRNKMVAARMQTACKGIRDRWGGWAPELFADIAPPRFTRHVLEMLHRMSKNCTHSVALSLLKEAIELRLKTPKTSKYPWITQNDVSKAVSRLKPRPAAQLQSQANPHKDDPKLGLKHSPYESADLGENGATKFDLEEDLNRPVSQHLAVSRASAETFEAERTAEDLSRDAMSQSVRHEPESVGQEGSANYQMDYLDVEDEEGLELESSELMVHDDVGDDSTMQISSDAPPVQKGSSDCQCPPIITKLRQEGSKWTLEERTDILHKAITFRLHRLCKPHLRALAAFSANLKNDIPLVALRKRLHVVFEYRKRLPQLHHRRPLWFLNPCNTAPSPVYRYPSTSSTLFEFDSAQVFERYAGKDSYKAWIEDGAIVVSHVFDFLKNLNILSGVHTEFGMYRHHHRPLSNGCPLGHLRNMYYSLIQQMMYQDPVWYALNAAARPDHNWRLITFPYVAGDKKPVGTTEALHLDLGLEQLVRTQSTASWISSKIALDSDPTDGGIIVVPGFHKHIEEWHSRLEVRHDDLSLVTKDCANIYNEQDRAEWGEPVYRPIQALDLRIMRPEILHGSPVSTKDNSRTLSAWHVGIDESHEHLDIDNFTSWSDLAACHRDLEAPVTDPSGHTLWFGRPEHRFPGAVVLESSSALGDALVGRRKWSDPQVIQERNILLGDDDHKASAYVAAVRSRMLTKYNEAFQALEPMERAAFKDLSYFEARCEA